MFHSIRRLSPTLCRGESTFPCENYCRQTPWWDLLSTMTDRQTAETGPSPTPAARWT